MRNYMAGNDWSFASSNLCAYNVLAKILCIIIPNVKGFKVIFTLYP